MFVSGSRKSEESCKSFPPKFLVKINDKLKSIQGEMFRKCVFETLVLFWQENDKKSVNIILV